jgi:hypothetical protein
VTDEERIANLTAELGQTNADCEHWSAEAWHNLQRAEALEIELLDLRARVAKAEDILDAPAFAGLRVGRALEALRGK